MVSTLRAALDDEAVSVVCAAAAALLVCVRTQAAEQAWHWTSLCPGTGATLLWLVVEP